jgi:peptidoglycan L-alanyl-D-glutamate endopeptidase CwlK
MLSKKSLDKLSTCDSRLRALVGELSTQLDIVVLCGHRTQEDQDKAVAGGFSKTKWPTSKHNSLPSKAVDIAPLPIDWDNTAAFEHMVDLAKKIAADHGMRIRCGADFKSFKDYPHIEVD